MGGQGGGNGWMDRKISDLGEEWGGSEDGSSGWLLKSGNQLLNYSWASTDLSRRRAVSRICCPCIPQFTRISRIDSASCPIIRHPRHTVEMSDFILFFTLPKHCYSYFKTKVFVTIDTLINKCLASPVFLRVFSGSRAEITVESPFNSHSWCCFHFLICQIKTTNPPITQL